MKKSCLPLHKLDHLQSPIAKRIVRCQFSSFPRRKLPTPLHDQLRLKKISKSLLPLESRRTDQRLGICSRGVAEAPARSSARAKHAQITPRTFRRARIHLHPSRALSRPPSATVPSTSGSFPTVRPGFPNRISTRRARLARRSSHLFSRARVQTRRIITLRASHSRVCTFATSRTRAPLDSPSRSPTWRGG